MNFYNSIGLIGANGASHGCAILVANAGKGSLLTCEHILHDTASNKLWFQFGIKKSYTPPGGFTRYQINNFEIQNSDLDTVLTENFLIPDAEYLTFEKILPAAGQNFKAFGYPVNDFLNALKENKNEPLVPFCQIGEFIGFENRIRLDNATGTRSFYAHNVGIIKMQSNDLSGFSGGLISTIDNRPIGLIVGQNDKFLLFTIPDLKDS
jgi:hypothetical protein